MNSPSDKELLEGAAKAAGIDAEIHSELGYGPEGLWLKGERSPDNSKYWNPLNCDGDALRLAVTLAKKYPAAVIGIFNRSAFPHASASVVHHDGSETYVEQDADNDLAAATRRAIVRAAYAIAGEAAS